MASQPTAQRLTETDQTPYSVAHILTPAEKRARLWQPKDHHHHHHLDHLGATLQLRRTRMRAPPTHLPAYGVILHATLRKRGIYLVPKGVAEQQDEAAAHAGVLNSREQLVGIVKFLVGLDGEDTEAFVEGLARERRGRGDRGGRRGGDGGGVGERGGEGAGVGEEEKKDVVISMLQRLRGTMVDVREQAKVQEKAFREEMVQVKRHRERQAEAERFSLAFGGALLLDEEDAPACPCHGPLSVLTGKRAVTEHVNSNGHPFIEWR